MNRSISPRPLSDLYAEMAELEYAIGCDWDESGGVFAVVDRSGNRLEVFKAEATEAGRQKVIEVADRYADEEGRWPHVVVESTRKPIVFAFVEAGFTVWQCNADALNAYRRNFSSNARSKNDRKDAFLLADRLLKMPFAHRIVRPLNDFALEITALSRMEVQLSKEIREHANRMRSNLLEFNRPVLDKWGSKEFAQSATPAAFVRVVPTTRAGAVLTEQELAEVIKGVGTGSHYLKQATALKKAYDKEYLTYPPELEGAMASIIRTNAEVLIARIAERDRMRDLITLAVQQHPLSELLKGAKGMGDLILPNLLGEIGDDPGRFGNLSNFKSFLAVVPFTEQSGSRSTSKRRRTRGNKAHKAMWDWATAVVMWQPGAKEYYWKLRGRGDLHPTAIRKVAERLASGLWHCWTTGTVWDDAALWKEPRPDLDQFVAETKERIRRNKSQQKEAAKPAA